MQPAAGRGPAEDEETNQDMAGIDLHPVAAVSVADTATSIPPQIQLVFDQVSVDVPIKDDHGKPSTKRILDSVSGIFGPDEAWAVMGPSGSGKTTLLNALTGVTKPTVGTITVNNHPFDRATMRQVSAFVPQDDLLTPTLTVHEALMDAALFKTGLPTQDREARVTTLISQFGLEECRDVLIGHPGSNKGISGGQKRRLSVALELCGNPSLLYLDEPTSGLDAVNTMSLVRRLSNLAASGVTVIATIHQPSAAAFFTFDRLLLLHRGQICYQGPVALGAQPVAFFAAAGFVCPALENPADFMFEVLVMNTAAIRAAYLEGSMVPEDAQRAPDAKMSLLPARRTASAYPASRAMQMYAHVRRNLLGMRRDPLLARIRVGSAVGVSLIVGVLYFDIGNGATGVNQIISLLVFSMIFLAITSALPVVIAILPEFDVVQKECRNNWYSPWAYVPAKLITELPLLVVPPLLFLAIMGNMTTLSWQTKGESSESDVSRFFMLYLALFLVVFATNSWAYFLSGLAPTTQIATLITPGSIMPMALLSGFFVNQQDMSWIFRWFTYINYLNYAWQALASASFIERTFDVPLATGLSTGDEILRTRLGLPVVTGSILSDYWANIGILVGFVIFFRILATVIIARRLRK